MGATCKSSMCSAEIHFWFVRLVPPNLARYFRPFLYLKVHFALAVSLEPLERIKIRGLNVMPLFHLGAR